MSSFFVALQQMALEKLQNSSSKDVIWGMFAFSALAFSWAMFFVNRVSQRRHEQKMRSRRVDNRRVRTVFFDMTNDTLRAQPLPKFSLEDWDHSLQRLIRDWNLTDQPSPLIVPANEVEADAMEDLIHTEASELLVLSLHGIRGFLQDDQLISEEDGFKHTRFLVAMARPHNTQITWFDAARMVIVPINTARRIATMDPAQLMTRLGRRNRETWVGVLKQMGLVYLQNQKARSKSADDSNGSKLRGVAVVDIAFDR